MNRSIRLAACILPLVLFQTGAFAQSSVRGFQDLPVPDRNVRGPTDFREGRSVYSTNNYIVPADPNFPLAPSLGTSGVGPTGSLDPTYGTMANPAR